MKQLVAIAEDDVLIEDATREAVPWWSYTKLVLAFGALTLAAQRRIALDAPLQGRPFSLRQLLQHRAGLPDYGDAPDYSRAVSQGDEPWDEATLLERVHADRLMFEPGQGWAYSNVGYLIVRHLVEDLTGEDIEAALRRLVFAPLGIDEPRLARTPADLDSTAWGNPARYDPRWVYHGLLVGCPGSAALLLWRIMTGRTLPAALREQFVHAYRLDVKRDPERPWTTPAYGLGVMIDISTDIAGHTGCGPGSTAAVYFASRRKPRRAVAVFCRHGATERSRAARGGTLARLDRMIGPAIAQRARITLAAARQTAQSRMREAGPMQKVRFVGLDVHKGSIAIAVAEGAGGAPENVATVPNDTAVLVKRLRKPGARREVEVLL
jgi:hypothetical protein